MARLRQVSKADAPPEVTKIYQELFEDRDPVSEPGRNCCSIAGAYLTTQRLSVE